VQSSSLAQLEEREGSWKGEEQQGTKGGQLEGGGAAGREREGCCWTGRGERLED